jgi:hypothetical protein
MSLGFAVIEHASLAHSKVCHFASFCLRATRVEPNKWLAVRAGLLPNGYCTSVNNSLLHLRREDAEALVQTSVASSMISLQYALVVSIVIRPEV